MVVNVSTGFQTAVPPPCTQQMIGQFGNPVGSHQIPHQLQGGAAFGYQPNLAQPHLPQQGIKLWQTTSRVLHE